MTAAARWALLVCIVLSSATFARGHRVRGYVTKKGTYVAPHYQSNANRTRLDNYSTKGNVNPYTGKRGTKAP